jgi:PPK2 family polyphosphate:nucleotide phosphotransferase
MYLSIDSPYLVAPGENFEIASSRTASPGSIDEKELKDQLRQSRALIAKLQHRMYAENQRSLLVIFQAMDAAGKDSTIRAVTKGINPAGCRVNSFKKPSTEELDHDYLWRTNKCMPERGCIGIFNRSYYEETIVVRVHPGILQYQRLPDSPESLEDLWNERFESINALEKHMARNGTVILKFWLNVSKEEQRKRFLSRLNEPEKHWKFSVADVKERGLWEHYMRAYEEMIRATSSSYAPWFAIPADNKPYMRTTVANIILQAMQQLDPHFPEVHEAEKSRFDEMRQLLESE